MYQRLSKEYDIIKDKENAEKYLQNYIINAPQDSYRWFKYAKLALSYGMQCKAEEFLGKVANLDSMSQLMRIIFGSLMI